MRVRVGLDVGVDGGEGGVLWRLLSRVREVENQKWRIRDAEWEWDGVVRMGQRTLAEEPKGGAWLTGWFW